MLTYYRHISLYTCTEISQPFVLEQILHLGAVGHSCFRVSMSVNCTACPPPLVLKTLPCGKEESHTNEQRRIEEETHTHNQQWKRSHCPINI